MAKQPIGWILRLEKPPANVWDAYGRISLMAWMLSSVHRIIRYEKMTPATVQKILDRYELNDYRILPYYNSRRFFEEVRPHPEVAERIVRSQPNIVGENSALESPWAATILEACGQIGRKYKISMSFVLSEHWDDIAMDSVEGTPDDIVFVYKNARLSFHTRESIKLDLWLALQRRRGKASYKWTEQLFEADSTDNAELELRGTCSNSEVEEVITYVTETLQQPISTDLYYSLAHHVSSVSTFVRLRTHCEKPKSSPLSFAEVIEYALDHNIVFYIWHLRPAEYEKVVDILWRRNQYWTSGGEFPRDRMEILATVIRVIDRGCFRVRAPALAAFVDLDIDFRRAITRRTFAKSS